MTERVFVGLSGGVDSSVAAFLLKQQGYQVEGVFMRNWSQDEEACQLKQDQKDAQDIAQHLDIPIHFVDFSEQYWKKVFEHFLKELEAQRTPNPDILCNRYVKFDAFYHWCKQQGADKIATGHYAALSSTHTLAQSRDRKKDQTYFLWAVPSEVWKDVIFPLANITKPEVRALAQDLGLVTSTKKDSTGICFIGPKNFQSFLTHYLPTDPGPIRTTSGAIIGRHQGLSFYTLGQRSGLMIGGVAGYSEAPWYVVGKDTKHNSLLVSQDPQDPLIMHHQLVATELTLQQPEVFIEGKSQRCVARIRHLQELQACTIDRLNPTNVQVTFDIAQRAITPGQSIVFYDGELCLAGAIIDKVLT